jgi:hypothetical protein
MRRTSCEDTCIWDDCLNCKRYPPSAAYIRWREFDKDPNADLDEWLRLLRACSKP